MKREPVAHVGSNNMKAAAVLNRNLVPHPHFHSRPTLLIRGPTAGYTGQIDRVSALV